MGVGAGGACCDGNCVVEASVLGGEAYFWEDIVCSNGGCTGGEGGWWMAFVAIVDNAEGFATSGSGGRRGSGRRGL